MDSPKGVQQAVIGILVTLGISVIAALVNRWIGAITIESFIGYIIVYALCCIFPYKIGRGSNPMRWAYAVIFGATLLFYAGGVGSTMPKADIVASIVIFPIELFILYRLFEPSASTWFSSKK